MNYIIKTCPFITIILRQFIYFWALLKMKLFTMFKITHKVMAFFLIALFFLASCSSSRKIKKKCLNCPEFSQTTEQHMSGSIYENI